ncbi:MAG TPA: efflux RND transporter permease subunit, partial [Gemmatimonadales bacterium]|nr:efflux RND transporter permease subunit [Gemmatimonadales bacterium]
MHQSDDALIERTHNTARYFTHQRQVAWVVLVVTVLWGIIGYARMPQRSEPEIPVLSAAVIVTWPGMDAARIEERVTRRLEEVIAEDEHVDAIRSTTRTGVAYIYIDLKDGTTGTGPIFDGIDLKLRAIHDLPEGVGPIQFIKDFGSTSALMLTVASPPIDTLEVELRAREIGAAIRRVRQGTHGTRAALVHSFPASVSVAGVQRVAGLYLRDAMGRGVWRNARLFQGGTFVGVDGETSLDDAAIRADLLKFVEQRLRVSELHPDAWPAIIIRDPAGAQAALQAVAGDKYTYRELEQYTDLMKRTLQTVPSVSKVDRLGVLDEQVTLSFSQERLASYGITVGQIGEVLDRRNIAQGGGAIEVEGRTVVLDPSGEFRSEREIGGVAVGRSPAGVPLYLRDVAEVDREYQNPARFLNYHTWRDTAGTWHRTRSVTLALQMRPGMKIGDFGRAVDSTLGVLRLRLPPDLILARTSDQPAQVEESVSLFMT